LATLLLALKGTLDDKQLYVDALSGSLDGKDPGEMYFDFRLLSAAEADDLNVHESTESSSRQLFVPCEKFLKIESIDASLVPARIAKERGFP